MHIQKLKLKILFILMERYYIYTLMFGCTSNSITCEIYSLYGFIETHSGKILFSVLVSVPILVVVLYNILHTKHQKEKLLEACLLEDRISRKLHDEISNEIYAALNHVERLQDIPSAEREVLVSKLNDLYKSTRCISRQTSSIDTGEEYKNQLKSMLDEFSNEAVNIIIKGINDIKWDNINEIKKINLYRVVQEIMINMYKHSKASVIIIDFKYQNKLLVINYKDNGIGMPANTIYKNGLRNVENRMETIGGTVIFENSPGKGLNITILFPAYKPYV